MRFALSILLVLGLTPSIAFPSIQFVTSELSLDGDYRGIWNASLDGQPGEDLLVLTWSRERGRTLAVHTQRPDGTYPARPDRRIEIKSDIVAFAIADVRKEPGAELLLFTRSSCFSYSTAKEGYAGNAARLLSWDLLCDMPAADELPLIDCARDLDGDGVDELVIPGPRGFGVFQRRDDGRYESIEKIDTPHFRPSRRAETQGFTISFQLGQAPKVTRYSNLFLLPAGVEGSDTSHLLRLARWLPAPAWGRINDDRRPDLCLLGSGDDEPQLRFYFQQAAASDPPTLFPSRPQHTYSMPPGSSVRLVDFDDDGRLDLLSSETEGRDTYRLRFYRNRDGHFEVAKPDQVMKFSGFRTRSMFGDFNGDGRTELAIVSFDIPDRDLKAVTIEQRLFLFSREEDRPFRRRPRASDVLRFSARDVDSMQRVRLVGSLDGGPGCDVVSVGRGGRVIARNIDTNLQIGSDPIWTHRPDRTVRDLEIVELNDDDRADLLMRHLKSIKVLVSRKRGDR